MNKEILTLIILLAFMSLVATIMIAADQRRQEYLAGCKTRGGEIVQLTARDGKTVCARIEIL